jgi:hypothetical protein
VTKRIDGDYTVTSIIKASALLPDTRTLFQSWDEGRTTEDNLREAERQNIFGKASRSRVRDILNVFRRRYFRVNGAATALQRLVCSPLPAEVTDRVFYYYAALAEPILYDFVTDFLYELYQRGRHVIAKEDTLDFIERAIADGRTAGAWRSAETRDRVARGVLATLRDFHILSGRRGSAKSKTFAPVHLPVEAFAFIAFDIHSDVVSGERLLRHPHWRLFLLDVNAVERLFVGAHQLGYLRYQAAGSIIRIEFPYHDLVALVDAVVETTLRV